ncbi:Glucose-induced degradation protein 8-like [Hondaea fermentalgiana]|uniref:Glucose-induced degradation protein 8-like n=1 Tax=Hondaea fermentalgiana TaxID=2315210 RepID=A0A2R5G0J1_9STRA|nr:Glucose-induced degradation protein 8-like [Hondaea fermentalgiana]|eukprot:GBG24547.1 Glucose-induced degradation protein 8-like [Hondaea fermentalgiana]
MSVEDAYHRAVEERLNPSRFWASDREISSLEDETAFRGDSSFLRLYDIANSEEHFRERRINRLFVPDVNTRAAHETATRPRWSQRANVDLLRTNRNNAFGEVYSRDTGLRGTAPMRAPDRSRRWRHVRASDFRRGAGPRYDAWRHEVRRLAPREESLPAEFGSKKRSRQGVADSPIDQRWHPSIFPDFVAVKADGLTASYVGAHNLPSNESSSPGARGDLSDPVQFSGTVFARHPLDTSMSDELAYFEVAVTAHEEWCGIQVGVHLGEAPKAGVGEGMKAFPLSMSTLSSFADAIALVASDGHLYALDYPRQDAVIAGLVHEYLEFSGYRRTLLASRKKDPRLDGRRALRVVFSPVYLAGCDASHGSWIEDAKSNPLATLQKRDVIRRLVLARRPLEAVKRLMRWYPASAINTLVRSGALECLRAQHFVELVAEGDSRKAVNFAQMELERSTATKLIPLVAYDDLGTSPYASLVSEDHREAVADTANRAMLALKVDPSQIRRQTNERAAVTARENTENKSGRDDDVDSDTESCYEDIERGVETSAKAQEQEYEAEGGDLKTLEPGVANAAQKQHANRASLSLGPDHDTAWQVSRTPRAALETVLAQLVLSKTLLRS